MYAQLGGSGRFSAREIEIIKARQENLLRNGIPVPRRPKAAVSRRPVDPDVELKAFWSVLAELAKRDLI